uniref:Uncharacterized protein n=1 Tax=Eutreptiella gymnastica TaxID=73025 RepID=A0A7S4FGP4_9EUGL
MPAAVSPHHPLEQPHTHPQAMFAAMPAAVSPHHPVEQPHAQPQAPGPTAPSAPAENAGSPDAGTHRQVSTSTTEERVSAGPNTGVRPLEGPFFAPPPRKLLSRANCGAVQE